MDKYYVTQKRLEELKQELEDFKTNRRREVADRLREAKELGDLSENTAYDEARNEQERVEMRIVELEEMIKNAEIITHAKGDSVLIGSKVSVKKGTSTKAIDYEIVGSEEADPLNGKISNESPLGKAFLGTRVGDKVTVATPAGIMHFQIVSIS
jgi:transcription elongation factor GreA